MNRTLATLVLLFSFGGVFAAQSLGDVARKEEARRKRIAKPAKVYTNDSLKPEPSEPSPAPAPATGAAVAAPAPASTAEPAPPSPSTAKAQAPAAPTAPDETKTEAYWRKRIADARAGLARAETFQEALQSRINALSTDFANRDDPAQRNKIAADRQKALAELDRVKREIQQYQKAITDIQEDARRAAIPPGWVR